MQEHVCVQEERIRSLENDRQETKVYVKIIREDLWEIKATLKSYPPPSLPPPEKKPGEEFWQRVIMKLLELITMFLAITAGIYGVTKIMKL
jgi:hypothetical protein